MNRWCRKLFSRQGLAGQRRLFLFCLLLFLVSAVTSFWLFFPADVLQRRLLSEVSSSTGLDMRGRNGAILFPAGLGLDLSIYPEVPGLADLELTELQISPVWSRLFSKNPAAHLAGTMSGGRLDVIADRTGQINLKCKNIALLPLQQTGLPYRIGGQLTGLLEGENMTANMTGQGEFSVQLTGTTIFGLEQLGLPANFSAGGLRLKGTLHQRRLNLEKVVLAGGPLELNGSGHIQIGATPEKTRLNLNLRLFPTSALPDSLRDLLLLTGVRSEVDGSYPFRLAGTLARPVMR